ncbi:MAG: hypothetical protein OES09_02770 [Gammaproteobacteria bacterium]|nr:hypothetical protein [Gammaproteobacteria bacterium]
MNELIGKRLFIVACRYIYVGTVTKATSDVVELSDALKIRDFTGDPKNADFSANDPISGVLTVHVGAIESRVVLDD